MTGMNEGLQKVDLSARSLLPLYPTSFRLSRSPTVHGSRRALGRLTKVRLIYRTNPCQQAETGPHANKLSGVSVGKNSGAVKQLAPALQQHRQAQ